MYFNRLSAGANDVKIDVGRTLALLLLGLAALVGAIVLFAINKNTGGTALLGVAEAILFGGFGIQFGERVGVETARRRLETKRQNRERRDQDEGDEAQGEDDGHSV